MEEYKWLCKLAYDKQLDAYIWTPGVRLPFFWLPEMAPQLIFELL